MVSVRRRDKIVIWPVYIDSSKTRREGRRVPRGSGVSSPKLSELLEAAEELGLDPEPVAEAAYPRAWWEKAGYLMAEKKFKKSKLLIELAGKVIELRKRSR